MRTATILMLSMLVGCSNHAQAPLTATDILVMRPVSALPAAVAYLTLTNSSKDTIVISRIRSPQYGQVEIHETIMDGDIARMRRLPELSVPPGKSIRLAPQGKHLMLMQPNREKIDAVELQLFSDESLLMRIAANVAE